MASFPKLLQIPPMVLEKIITKCEAKSYFRLQQTCRDMQEFVKNSKKICVHLRESNSYDCRHQASSFVFEAVNSKGKRVRIPIQALHGIRLTELNLARLFYEDEHALNHFLQIIEKNRIRCDTISACFIDWTVEQFTILLKIVKPSKVDINGAGCSSFYEILLEAKDVTTVCLILSSGEFHQFAGRFMATFPLVNIHVLDPGDGDIDAPFEYFDAILQILHSDPPRNLRDFYFCNLFDPYYPTVNKMEEQFRHYNPRVQEFTEPSYSISAWVDLPEALPSNAFCKIRFGDGGLATSATMNYGMRDRDGHPATTFPFQRCYHKMTSFPKLLQIPPMVLEKIITKCEVKSYFRLQQTCRDIQELINNSKKISVHFSEHRFYYCSQQGPSFVLEAISVNGKSIQIPLQHLHGIRLSKLNLPRYFYETVGRLNHFLEIIEKNNIRCNNITVYITDWRVEQFEKFLNNMKPTKVDTNDSGCARHYEILLNAKEVKAVSLMPSPDDFFRFARRFMTNFSCVSLEVSDPDKNTDIGISFEYCDTILQILHTNPPQNLRDFYFSYLFGRQYPTVDEMEEQFRNYNPRVRCEVKSYFRLQQTCRDIQEFVKNSKNICVNLEECVYCRKEGASFYFNTSYEVNDKRLRIPMQYLHGIRLAELCLTPRFYENRAGLKEFLKTLEKNRIKCRYLITLSDWTAEQFEHLLRMVKPWKVQVYSGTRHHVLPPTPFTPSSYHEIILRAKGVVEVTLTLSPDDFFRFARRLMNTFILVNIHVYDPDNEDAAFEYCHTILQILHTDPPRNLRDFYFESRFGSQHPTMEEMKEQFRHYNPRVEEFTEPQYSISAWVDLPETLPSNAFCKIRFGNAATINYGMRDRHGHPATTFPYQIW